MFADLLIAATGQTCSSEEPTAALRWQTKFKENSVSRDLQQKWRVKTYQDGRLISEEGVWRDVPEADEGETT